MANKKAKKTKNTAKKPKIDPTWPNQALGARHGDGTAVASGEVRRGTLRTRNTGKKYWQELGKNLI